MKTLLVAVVVDKLGEDIALIALVILVALAFGELDLGAGGLGCWLAPLVFLGLTDLGAGGELNANRDVGVAGVVGAGSSMLSLACQTTSFNGNPDFILCRAPNST